MGILPVTQSARIAKERQTERTKYNICKRNLQQTAFDQKTQNFRNTNQRFPDPQPA